LFRRRRGRSNIIFSLLASFNLFTCISFCPFQVLGADSRVSTGTYIANRVSDKVAALHDSIFMCRSGSAADTQAISDYVRFFLSSHAIDINRPPSVKTAANLARKLCYENKDALMAGVIVGGWDPIDGGSVYVLPLGGTLMKLPFAIGGSGSSYIYGHVDSEYKPGMSREECQQFVRKAISHAMARDGSSGGIIRLVTVDANGTDREYIPGDKLPYMPV
jgi:20S proteasome subunit beta 1